ncbi:hypothetical protein ID866_9649 [Astraeus odoratus]|nr:hypothetical protein ID866_9649 [Astraeus odoratus]
MDRKGIQLPHFHSHEPSDPDRPTKHREWPSLRCLALVVLGMVISASYFQYGRWHSCRAPPLVLDSGPKLPPEVVQRAWAAYSPYYPAAKYEAPPDHCVITQVNLLQRHGARYPTKGATERMKESLQKLLDVHTYTDATLEFLRDFEWDLGTASLISIGKKQSFESGVEHFTRYRHLFSSSQLPFVRSSGSDRVIKTAKIWNEAIAQASNGMYRPVTSVILSEADGANNTLDDGSCPRAQRLKERQKAWRNIFAPPIVERLNIAAPGADLKEKDIVELMPLCAFETLFHGTTSPFCDMFTLEDFLAYEYYEDLARYYGTGPGNPLGPIQGVGYVNELIARLTSQPVRDRTQTNHTLDSSPETFPLDRTFYADFSHDNQLIAIYSALGLFQEDGEPRLEEHRRWRVSRMTPFSARMIVEKLACGGGRKEYVRVLVNDAVQPLDFCGAGDDGMCTLEDFVESQTYARGDGNGDWEACFD